MGGKGSGRPGGNPDLKNSSPAVQSASWNVDESMNSKVIAFATRIASLPALDYSDSEMMENRLSEYFQICAEMGLRPTMASMAQAFGLPRSTFGEIAHGFSQGVTHGLTPPSISVIKKGYETLATVFDSMLYEEKGSPVKWIFVGKNSFGYVDQKEQRVIHEDSTKRLSGATLEEVADRYKALSGVEIGDAQAYELPEENDSDHV